MRSSSIRQYLKEILIYTMGFVIFLIAMDHIFNGVLLDFLYNSLPYPAFLMINNNRMSSAFLVYIMGLVIISMAYVFKLSKLLQIAGRSIVEDNPEILGKNCPEELKEFSQKLKEFKYDLKINEQARKMAEQQKSDLVVYLAHDLKTPLTSVIGYLSILKEAKDLPAEQRARYTVIALDKAYRLEQLINEFFDITRLNLQTIPAYKAPVNLTVLMMQIIEEFYPIFEEKQMRVAADIEPELVLNADADKLARVFDNLFRNAASYAREGTEIGCKVYKKGKQVIISVQNEGDHIPPEKLKYIFEKFYRLDQARQSASGGAGLGLAIAKQIVELHGGTIEASCTEGITEFKVVLSL